MKYVNNAEPSYSSLSYPTPMNQDNRGEGTLEPYTKGYADGMRRVEQTEEYKVGKAILEALDHI